jgi:hypothetical protein
MYKLAAGINTSVRLCEENEGSSISSDSAGDMFGSLPLYKVAVNGTNDTGKNGTGAYRF